MSYRLRIWLYCMLLRMSSVKIKKIKVFFAAPIMSDSEKSRFPKYAMLGSGRLLPRAHFMRYIFSSIQFNSFHFISILFSVTKITNEKEWKRNKTKITKCNEILRKKRNITKKTKYYEKNENYEILRKKRKLRNITKYYEKKENAIKTSRYRDILC